MIEMKILTNQSKYLIWILMFLILGFAADINGATRIVTKTNDTDDGVCNADCSLREAIAVSLDGDTITFDPVTFASPRTIELTRGQLVIGHSVNITGVSTNQLSIWAKQVSGMSAYRAISTSAAFGTLTISNLTIYGGQAQRDFGGAILNTGNLSLVNVTISGNSAGEGGAIDNRGVLTATNVTIRNNTAAGRGGGIINSGSLTVESTAFVWNQVGGFGGAVYNAGGTMNLRNVTIVGNSAGSSGFGGVYVISGSGSLESATIANNSNGGIWGSGTTVANSIIANNSCTSSGCDTAGSLVSRGYNLFKDPSPGSISGDLTGNIIGVDPLLDTEGARNNGGLTPTVGLLPSSPAIDKGSSTFSELTKDQRGFTRPYDNPNIANATGGNGTDIGAFELQAFAVKVSGRVVNGSGKPVRGALVTLTNNSNGNGIIGVTNPFGYFFCSNVPVAQTYSISIQTKRYTFAPRAVTIIGDRDDLEISAMP